MTRHPQLRQKRGERRGEDDEDEIHSDVIALTSPCLCRDLRVFVCMCVHVSLVHDTLCSEQLHRRLISYLTVNSLLLCTADDAAMRPVSSASLSTQDMRHIQGFRVRSLFFFPLTKQPVNQPEIAGLPFCILSFGRTARHDV